MKKLTKRQIKKEIIYRLNKMHLEDATMPADMRTTFLYDIEDLVEQL
jgi:hypothetical protein